MQAVGLASDTEAPGGAGARGLGRGDRLGIVDAHERLPAAAPLQLRRQRGAVPRGAAADVVADIEQTDRGWQPLRALDRVRNVGQVDLELRPHLPQRQRNPVGFPLRGRRVAVGDDGHRGAHLLDVGVGESLPEAGSEDLRALPDGIDALHERRQRRFVGALLVDADPQRRKHRGHLGRDLAVQPVDEQARRFQAALALVHVRVGAVGDDRVDRVDHALREVGVRVAGCDDRHLRPHERADRLQPVAVQVPCRLADAGPVRRDQQPVQRQVRADLREQAALQFRVGVVGYQAVGQRPRAEERNRRDAGFVQAGKEACQLVVGALDRVAERIPCRQQAAAKRGEVGGRLDEGVGLVL